MAVMKINYLYVVIFEHHSYIYEFLIGHISRLCIYSVEIILFLVKETWISHWLIQICNIRPPNSPFKDTTECYWLAVSNRLTISDLPQHIIQKVSSIIGLNTVAIDSLSITDGITDLLVPLYAPLIIRNLFTVSMSCLTRISVFTWLCIKIMNVTLFFFLYASKHW